MRRFLFFLAPICLTAVAVACAVPSLEGDDLGDLTPPDRVPMQDSGVDDPVDGQTINQGDLDSSAGDTGGGDAADAAKPSYVAFASSGLYTGALGGIAGADAKCQALATAKGFPGTFKAWLSVAGTNAADRITAPGPWLLPNGSVVATSRAQLVSGNIENLPNRDENNATLPAAEDRTWTATSGTGAYTGPDCTGWTATGGAGLVGEAAHKNSQWTALENEACSEVNRVYCFEN